MTLPGDALEQLDYLVQEYNESLLAEKRAERVKKASTEGILAILKQHQCSSTEAGGCTLTVRPWTRKSISMDMAEMHLDADLLARVVRTSSGVSLDVRPLRGGG